MRAGCSPRNIMSVFCLMHGQKADNMYIQPKDDVIWYYLYSDTVISASETNDNSADSACGRPGKIRSKDREAKERTWTVGSNWPSFPNSEYGFLYFRLISFSM
jgi:hypothetical protein